MINAEFLRNLLKKCRCVNNVCNWAGSRNIKLIGLVSVDSLPIRKCIHHVPAIKNNTKKTKNQ